MRKVTIGRGRNCDIIIYDKTDTVSRRQAIITVTFWGRMTIYDTSSNGTYVNGVRIVKPAGKVVTRSDKINFGQVWEFDWATMKDPYRKMKMFLLGVVLGLLVLGAIGLAIRPWAKLEQAENPRVVADTIAEPDTTQVDTLKKENFDISEETLKQDAVKPKTSDKKPETKESKRSSKNSYLQESDSTYYYDVADSVAIDLEDAAIGADVYDEKYDEY